MELFAQLARHLSRIAGPLLVGVFFLFQIHQLVSFNTYWGYDGGAHLHILDTLRTEGRFPSLEENYLAWHEPLYYLGSAGLGVVGVGYKVTHAFIILALDVLIYALWKRIGLSNIVSALGTSATLALPAFLEVSMFLTNEALNYVFILAIVHCGITLVQEERWSWKSSMVFAVCVGLGVITKITAMVAFGVVAVLLVIKMLQKKTWKYVATLVFAMCATLILYTPWYLVRSSGLDRASINNYDMLPAQSFAWDSRGAFMMRFDADIFRFPFWYSGGTGFWSMLYADTVSDYLGIFENQDIKNALPETERVLTTHNGNTVSAYRVPLARWAMVLGIVPVLVMVAGLAHVATVGYASAFLLALMYYAYRYPYYDQGVVKAIFIAPVFALLLASGVKEIEKRRKSIANPCVRGALGWFLYGAWAGYVVVVLALFFIRS